MNFAPSAPDALMLRRFIEAIAVGNLSVMYRKRYPPTRYVFYPLYRYFRRGTRMPGVLAYLMVWSISAVLHAALMLLFGHPVAALVLALLFFSGGLAGSVAIVMKNRRKVRQHRKQGTVETEQFD